MSRISCITTFQVSQNVSDQEGGAAGSRLMVEVRN
jgi:hypothetical protein